VWARAAATHFLYCLTLVFGALLILGQSPCAKAGLSSRGAHISAAAALRHPGLHPLDWIVTEAVPAARSQITGQAWIYVLLTVFIPFLYLANFVNSLITRRIRWRGVNYELISSEQTRIG